MRRKKICFIVALLITGGSDKLLLAQSSILINEGFEVVLYSVRPIDKNILYKEFIKKGVCIKDYSRGFKYFLNIIKYIIIVPGYLSFKIYYSFKHSNNIDIYNKIHIIFENAIIPRLCEPILFFRILIDTLRFKYDIISASHFSTLRIIYFLKKTLNVNTIYTEISSPRWRRSHLKRKGSGNYLNSLDEIVVPSKIIGNELIQYDGLNKEYIVTPFFIERQDYYNKKIDRKAKSFGVIARLSREKNQYILIKVLKSIIDQGKDARLVLIGTGPEELNYKNLASELGIIEKVRFIPFFNEINEIIDEIDIFVLCSDVEGMSLSLIEALYFGKPIIATDVGANSELVINGFNGFLVDKTNTRDIAEKIITIMDNGDLYRDFSENSRKLYDKKFNPEILSKQLLAIYKR